MFVNRDQELRALENRCKSGESEFAILYGCRIFVVYSSHSSAFDSSNRQIVGCIAISCTPDARCAPV